MNPKPYDPANEELNWRLGLINYHLTGNYQRCNIDFRAQTSSIYMWSWGGDFRKHEPGAWFSKRSAGIIRKGKNKIKDLKQSVMADHERPLVLLYEDLKQLGTLSNEQLYDWLVQHNHFVHIHAEEDAALTAKGWRDRKRPTDAYKQLGIEIYFVPKYDRNKPIPAES